ncbi:MAG: CxxC-x17-CxxC domain-containing protein [Candidatus Paceibacterota bacterium]
MEFKNDREGGFKRQMVQGNWKCADCGAEITELPFEPRDGSSVYCRECYAKRRPPRRDFRR